MTTTTLAAEVASGLDRLRDRLLSWCPDHADPDLWAETVAERVAEIRDQLTALVVYDLDAGEHRVLVVGRDRHGRGHRIAAVDLDQLGDLGEVPEDIREALADQLVEHVGVPDDPGDLW
jgi:hypothetical protein